MYSVSCVLTWPVRVLKFYMCCSFSRLAWLYGFFYRSVPKTVLILYFFYVSSQIVSHLLSHLLGGDLVIHMYPWDSTSYVF